MKICIIGAGFTGLAAGLELLEYKPALLELEDEVGGLAAGFNTSGQKLERFYHHWFTNDEYIMGLVESLSLTNELDFLESKTGMYFNQSFFKLSSPIDLLKFKALTFISRIRLGVLVLWARRVKDWMALESITAKEWLTQIAGEQVYRVVWEPLLKGKFGPYAEKVSAVWFWKKLCLRGGSRGKNGKEQLVYFEGGFMRLANEMASKITSNGGTITTGVKVEKILIENNQVKGLQTNNGIVECDRVIVTTALPILAKMVEGQADQQYINSLLQINYIGNVCLIMELDRSLSSYYWLNVNDPSFPFVGIIEHTNLVNKALYGDSHIVYLSKYLPTTDHIYKMDVEEFLDYATPYIQKMFPNFERSWIKKANLWKAEYSQPIVEKFYSSKIPEMVTPIGGLYLSTMAQIYPEDRGTNYAVQYGQKVAQLVKNDL
ncbi:NAD(P)/FAD-dependent oxidoreductase [Polynucleobacter sp. AP-Elch-400A-B2]|uniref:NAD(P)/FAD-dependent oxidoreductase n=1 Tax=Polynucleobacter sp. AP-Elch-400A-B2 TaxID=2576930 RepID=UPI001BFE97EE|nr:NAD(P)/FAD-dependent oxidoreductase [Polynucleobacter sp. AP-Elch-400A-B2]QWE24999.1 NAD(P)/FAD-dependent oxidoreductase [Polynucleobacter sp. AP-Elch-400A-B2]